VLPVAIIAIRAVSKMKRVKRCAQEAFPCRSAIRMEREPFESYELDVAVYIVRCIELCHCTDSEQFP
jgi:hypothetical protein